MDAVEVCASCAPAPACAELEVRARDRDERSKGREAVGVTGLVGLDDDGSELPSLVRFFLRNPPRLGIRQMNG